MNCPACGEEASDHDRFCPRCGAFLERATSESTSAKATASAESPDPSLVGDRVQGVPANDERTGQQAQQGRTESSSPGIPYYPQSSSPTYPPPPPLDATTGQWATSGYLSSGPTTAFGAIYAGWWQRVGASILDGLILAIPYFIVSSILRAAFGSERLVTVGSRLVTEKVLPTGVSILLGLVFLCVQALYFTRLNGEGSGQTVGNRAPGIAVRDIETGQAIGTKRGLLRWFVRIGLYILLVIPGIVNDLFPLWDSRHQTLADKAAHSVVIRLK